MNVKISNSEKSEKLSGILTEVSHEIERVCSVKTVISFEKIDGGKSIGITDAISIGSLALSTLTTAVTILTYISSQRGNYKVVINKNDSSYEITTKSEEELQRFLGKFNDDDQIVIQVKDESKDGE